MESLYRDQVLLSRLRGVMGGVLDLERLTARVAMDKAHAKDLLAVRSTLDAVLALGELLVRTDLTGLAAPLLSSEPSMKTLAALLERAVCDEPAIVLNEGNLIKRGFDRGAGPAARR